MSDKELDPKQFETYKSLINALVVIGAVVGTFMFRLKVMTGWHMPQSVRDGDGGPIIFIIVGFFTEFIPLIVAAFPGGIMGALAGGLAGCVLALIIMIIATTSESVSTAYSEHKIYKENKLLCNTRNSVLKMCTSKETAVQNIQRLISDKDCCNTGFLCASLFDYIGNACICEIYKNMKLEDNKEVFEKVKKIASDNKFQINIDTWSIYSLNKWCSHEIDRLKIIMKKVGDAELLELKNLMNKV